MTNVLHFEITLPAWGTYYVWGWASGTGHDDIGNEHTNIWTYNIYLDEVSECTYAANYRICWD